MVAERMRFVEFWARYVATHDDKEWSVQQKVLIDGQFPSKMTKEEFLRMKKIS